jgi:hypothetical protein
MTGGVPDRGAGLGWAGGYCDAVVDGPAGPGGGRGRAAGGRGGDAVGRRRGCGWACFLGRGARCWLVFALFPACCRTRSTGRTAAGGALASKVSEVQGIGSSSAGLHRLHFAAITLAAWARSGLRSCFGWACPARDGDDPDPVRRDHGDGGLPDPLHALRGRPERPGLGGVGRALRRLSRSGAALLSMRRRLLLGPPPTRSGDQGDCLARPPARRACDGERDGERDGQLNGIGLGLPGEGGWSVWMRCRRGASRDLELGGVPAAADRHEAISAPYHRNQAGMLAQIGSRCRRPEEAQRRMGEVGVDYLVLCGLDPSWRCAQRRRGGSDPLRLARGEARLPGWPLRHAVRGHAGLRAP